ncbi:hypothetical protein Tco_1258251 [Tanacetum coccineum]
MNNWFLSRLACRLERAIFRISVDILQNTNFFSAFTRSVDVPSIYVQQFWNTLTMDTKSGVYSFQLDELWFPLDVDLLCSARGITPKDSAHPFVAPPAGVLVIDFVNNLGYPEELQFVYISCGQIFCQCLTGKTFGSDRPRHLVLKILWGVVSGINIDYAEHIWEEFVQAIKTFFSDATNLKVPSKKPKPHVIPYCRFTKLIICYLGGRHNIHKRPQSPLHITAYDYSLGNLKFVPKGELDEPRQANTVTDKEGGKKKKAPPDGKSKQPRWTPVTQDASTGPSTQPQDDTSANMVHDTLSPADTETGADTKKSNSVAGTEILNVGEEQGEDVSNTVALEERTIELDEGKAGSEPGKRPESRPPPECVLMEEDQAGSNPRQSHVVQAGTNPEPMHEDFFAINLDDAFTFGDQFLNDKSLEDEPGKTNVETEVKSMVIVPIHQASSLAPPLSTPIIDLTPPKPVSPLVQETIFTVTTATKTTLLPPPPPQQQNTIDSKLATRVSNHDLYSKIVKYVNEVVKEAVHNALQALLRERFINLSEFEMKEILHDRMFESGSYRSHPEHTALYDALELSIDCEKREEFKESLAWKTPDIREAPSSSSKQKYASPSEQPVDDVLIPDDVHLSDSVDTGAAHLPKIKTRPDWLKPLPEEAPETPEPN